MVDFLVFSGNMALGFAVGLWGLKLCILRDAQKKKILVNRSEVVKTKLRLCGLAKYFVCIFVVLRFILFVVK